MCGEGFARLQPQKIPGAPLLHPLSFHPACLPTISGHIQLHQLHEVSYFRRQPLDLVVTEAQLSQVQ